MTRGTKDVSHLRATLSLQSPVARDMIPSSPCTGIPATAPSSDHYRPAGLLTLYFLFLTCHFIPRLSLDTPPNAPHISENLEFLCPASSPEGLELLLSGPTPSVQTLLLSHSCVMSFPSIFSHSFLISPLSPSHLDISSFLSICPNLNRNNFSHNFPSNKRAKCLAL